MNQPWIYTYSSSQSPLPPPSPPDPSGSSQCTSHEHLSHASTSGWWYVSPLIIYMFRCCSLKTSHPRPLLGIHTEETRSERDTCNPMFIAALFIVARTWKQPRCPSADEWIRKLWYIYTMECYSAIKKSSFESVLMRWMELEPIIQSEVSQKDKDQYSTLTHIYGI